MNFYNQVIDKKGLKRILSWFLENYGPTRTSELIEYFKLLGFHYATKAGLSLGFDDLRIPSTKNTLLQAAQKQVKNCENNYLRGSITALERYEKLIDIWTTTSENLKEEVIQNFQRTPLNPLYMMAFSGARGNISQVRQLVGMRGLMSDSGGGIIDFPIRSNFREGLSVTEYVISCYGARKGLIDTALRTADSGYLTRRLVDVAHGILIGEIDCFTKASLSVPLAEKNILGRVLAENLSDEFFSGSKLNLMGSTQLDFAKTNSFPSPENKNGNFEAKNLNSQFRTKKNSPMLSQSLRRGSFAWKNQDISWSLSTEILARISSKRTEIRVRSPLTCDGLYTKQPPTAGNKKLINRQSGKNESQNAQSRLNTDGICQLCYGWNLSQGRLVSIGDAVGVLAAQSIGEPGTQLTMRTFHTGGIFSTDVQDKIFAPHEGFVAFYSRMDSRSELEGQASESNIHLIPSVSSPEASRFASKDTRQKVLGCKVRSVHGETGFLSFEPLQISISVPLISGGNKTELETESKEQKKNDSINRMKSNTKLSILQLPAQTLIFVYPGKFIQKNTLCAEISRVRPPLAIKTFSVSPPRLLAPAKEEKTEVALISSVFNEGENRNEKQKNEILVSINPLIVARNSLIQQEKRTQIIDISEKNKKENNRLRLERTNALRAKIPPAAEIQTEEMLSSPVDGKNVLSEIQGQVALAPHGPNGRGQEVWVLAGEKYKFSEWSAESFSPLHFPFSASQTKNELASSFLPAVAEGKRSETKTQTRKTKQAKSQKLDRGIQQPFQVGDLLNWKGFRGRQQNSGLDFSSFPSFTDARIAAISSEKITRNEDKKPSFEIRESVILYSRQQKSFSSLYARKHSGNVSELKQKAKGIGELIRNGNQLQYTAQIIALRAKKQVFTSNKSCKPEILDDQTLYIIRRVQPHLFSGNILSTVSDNKPLNLRPIGSVVQERDVLFQLSLPVQQSKTGDIVQGLPKIEQLFEGRGGSLFDEGVDQNSEKFSQIPLALRFRSLSSDQKTTYKELDNVFRGYESDAFSLVNDPAKKRFILQRRLVDEIQSVYQSQGVEIADKHVEIIVRQMTSKVKILEKGETPFFPDDIVDFESLRRVNPEHTSYEPIILGITKVAFFSDSFISAASFQETKRVLMHSAIQTRVDFLTGLKENVIVGRLIPAGTGQMSL